MVIRHVQLWTAQVKSKSSEASQSDKKGGFFLTIKEAPSSYRFPCYQWPANDRGVHATVRLDGHLPAT